MTDFEVHQCTNPDCGLRLPVDLEVFQGKYCPKCGAAMDCLESISGHLPSRTNEEVKHREIVVVLDNIRSAHNVGSIFRTAEGAGIKHIYLCGITPTPEEKPILGKTALGSELVVPWSSHLNGVVLARKLIGDGHCLLALERTLEAVSIFDNEVHEVSDRKPLALILGNERAGVDPGLIDLCEAVLALPMIGQKSSLNVAVAFGVAVYWLAFS